MPCVVAGETSIPLAKYGDSNAGQMKTVYRRGLGHRYGRVMQVIAGVHFNFSFDESFWPVYFELINQSEAYKEDPQAKISEAYFSMLRNLQRLGWMDASAPLASISERYRLEASSSSASIRALIRDSSLK